METVVLLAQSMLYVITDMQPGFVWLSVPNTNTTLLGNKYQDSKKKNCYRNLKNKVLVKFDVAPAFLKTNND